MPTSKKKQVQAMEDKNWNDFNESPTSIYEPLVGEGLDPDYFSLEDFKGIPRPDPMYNDVHRNNDTLVVSRRLDRIARQMVKNGFRGA